MTTIQENIDRIRELERKINSHLVGGNFTYTDYYIQMIFFEHWMGVGGIRVSLKEGKIKALERMLAKLNKYYNDTFSWSSHHVDLV